MIFNVRVYVAQFESLVGRWEERYDLAQPDSPGLHIVMMFILVEQNMEAGKKEVDLTGVSSESCAGAGALDFF